MVGAWVDPNSQLDSSSLTVQDLGCHPNFPVTLSFADSLGGQFGSAPQVIVGVVDGFYTFPVPTSQASDLQSRTLFRPDSEITLNSPNLVKNSNILDFAVTTDNQNYGAFFDILEDGNLYFASAHNIVQTTQLSKDIPLKQVVADLNAKGQLEAFAVSIDNKLYHIHQEPSSDTGWSQFFNLGANVSQVALGKNSDGYLEVFATGTTNGVLRHIWQDPDTTDWQDTSIEIQTNGTIESIMSYSTEVTVLNDAGQPMPNQAIKIWADDRLRLEINGGSYWVDASRPASLTTNSIGQLTIIAPTNSFSTSLLKFWTEGMTPGTTVVLEPNLAEQDSLRTVSPQDLLNAQDKEGNYLLQGSYRNQDTANNLSQAIQQSMSLVAPTVGSTAAVANLVGQKTQRSPLYYLESSEPVSGKIDLRAVPEQHWCVSFASGQPVFTVLERSEAESRIAELKATLPQYGGFLGIDWGDVWESVKEGVAELSHIVVNTVSEGIHVFITFVVNGFQHVYDGVITLVEEAFDLVEGLYEQVKVTYEQLSEWLGFYFDWDDIKRTAETIEHSFNEIMDFTVLAVQYLKGKVDKQLQSIEANLQTQVDQYIQTLDPNQTLGQAAQEYVTPSPVFDDNIGHNILLNAFINNYSQLNVANPAAVNLTATGQSSPFQAILDTLNELVDTFETGAGKKAFDDAIVYFEQIKNGPSDQALQLTLSGLLKIVEGIALASLTAINVVIDALFDGVDAVIQALKALVNEDWRIPIVSELYQEITGESLTFKPIQIISLMIAIPGTAIYKGLIGSSPYPTEQSVTDFKNFFTATWLAQQSGITGEDRGSLDSSNFIDLPPIVRISFNIFYSVNFVLRTVVESVQNPTPPTQEKPPMGTVGVLLRLLSSGFSCPWVVKQNPGEFVGGDIANSFENWIWACQLMLGPIRGGLVLILEAEEIGDGTLFAWGAFHLAMVIALAIVEATEGKSDPAKAIENVLTCLAPQFLKCLRFKPIIAATEEWSLPVYGVVTFVTEPMIAVSHFVRNLPPAEQLVSGYLSPDFAMDGVQQDSQSRFRMA